MTVRITSDEFGIADGVKQTHQRIPLGDVNWLAIRIMTVELKDGCCLGAIVNPTPAESGDIFQGAVQ